MTIVTETVPETEKVEREKTEVDFETVTKEVEKVKCNCCGQRWDPDGRVETREIVVDPSATATVQTNIGREQRAYQTSGFPHENKGSLDEALHEILQGFEIRVPNPEHRASDMSNRHERDGKNICTTLAEAEQRRRDRATSMGKVPRYNYTYGFHVELPVQGKTKHLCEYCYEVVFNA